MIFLSMICAATYFVSPCARVAPAEFVAAVADTIVYPELSLDSLKPVAAAAAAIDSIVPLAKLGESIDSVAKAAHRSGRIPGLVASLTDIINASPRLLALVASRNLSPREYALAFVRVRGAWFALQWQRYYEASGSNGSIVSMFPGARKQDVPFVKANEAELVKLGFPRPQGPDDDKAKQAAPSK